MHLRTALLAAAAAAAAGGSGAARAAFAPSPRARIARTRPAHPWDSVSEAAYGLKHLPVGLNDRTNVLANGTASLRGRSASAPGKVTLLLRPPSPPPPKAPTRPPPYTVLCEDAAGCAFRPACTPSRKKVGGERERKQLVSDLSMR